MLETEKQKIRKEYERREGQITVKRKMCVRCTALGRRSGLVCVRVCVVCSYVWRGKPHPSACRVEGCGWEACAWHT